MKKLLIIALVMLLFTIPTIQGLDENVIEAPTVVINDDAGFYIYVTNEDELPITVEIELIRVSTNESVITFDYGYKLGPGATKGSWITGIVIGSEYTIKVTANNEVTTIYNYGKD
jgi:hypothetical protein